MHCNKKLTPKSRSLPCIIGHKRSPAIFAPDKNQNSLVTIICPKHGPYKQRAAKHIRTDGEGWGCLPCWDERRGKSIQLDTSEFIRRSRAVYAHRDFDYSGTKYSRYHDNVMILCSDHGPFKVTPASHLSKTNGGRGGGCPDCRYLSASVSLRRTTERFVEEARSIHGDRFDYSLVEYGANELVPVTIICREHGPFEQTPGGHVVGKVGCQQCELEAASERYRRTTEEFVEVQDALEISEQTDV